MASYPEDTPFNNFPSILCCLLSWVISHVNYCPSNPASCLLLGPCQETFP